MVGSRGVHTGRLKSTKPQLTGLERLELLVMTGLCPHGVDLSRVIRLINVESLAIESQSGSERLRRG